MSTPSRRKAAPTHVRRAAPKPRKAQPAVKRVTPPRARTLTARPPQKKLQSSRPHQGISSPAIGSGTSRISLGSRGKLGQSLRVQGTEYITAINMPSSGPTTPDVVLYTRANVAGPTATRLHQFASIYERWHPRKYQYRFTSSCPTSTSGTFVMGQDPDPIESYESTSTGLIARLRSLPGSVMFQAWQSANCNLSPSQDYTSLWCIDPDPLSTEADRLDQAGNLVFAIAATPNLAAGATVGILELDYDIEFYSPKLTSDAVVAAADFMFTSDAQDSMLSTTVQYLFNAALTYAKANIAIPSSQTMGIIGTILRSYLDLNTGEADPDEGKESKSRLAVAPLDAGFTTGTYTMSFTVATNYAGAWELGTDPTIDPFFRITTQTTHRVRYAEDSCRDPITTTTPCFMPNWLGPDGNPYRYAWNRRITFAVDGEQRGFCDCPSQYNFVKYPFNPWTVYGMRTFFQFKKSGAGEFITVAGPAASATVRVKHRPSQNIATREDMNAAIAELRDGKSFHNDSKEPVDLKVQEAKDMKPVLSHADFEVEDIEEVPSSLALVAGAPVSTRRHVKIVMEPPTPPGTKVPASRTR